MSSVKSRVKRALKDEQTAGESDLRTSRSSSESHSMTEDELTQAVKQGVTEVLEERSMGQQEGEPSGSDDMDESESSGRSSGLRLLVLGSLVAIGMLARRRMKRGGSESTTDYQEPGE